MEAPGDPPVAAQQATSVQGCPSFNLGPSSTQPQEESWAIPDAERVRVSFFFVPMASR